VLPNNLLDQVRKTLGENSHTQKLRITADDEDGVLVLRGSVSSYYLKQMSQESIRGLLDDYDPRPVLRNLIEVNGN
jgi:hypothetical protein